MSDMSKMKSFQWLDFSVVNERNKYHNAWIESLSKRPHDHPGFLEMMKPALYRPFAVIYQHSSSSRIIYPFYCCCLKDFPAFSDLNTSYMHMVSPYGYGGPLYEGLQSEHQETSIAFEKIFNDELSKRDFVSEFVREDIFSERLAIRSSGTLVEQQPNVVVRLQRSDEDIWRTYKAKVRKNVNRANEFLLNIKFDRDGEYLAQFIEIYYETMKRTAASKNFMIPEEKFRNITETLGHEGGVMYVHISDGERIVSSEMLLLSPDTIYSFLGGTLEGAFEKRPNDLLKHEVVQWGRKNGFKWYVLGGGLTPLDGIFRYKQAFDPESIFPFYVRKNIVNPDIYQSLVAKRCSFESGVGNNWIARPDFFPEYLS